MAEGNAPKGLQFEGTGERPTYCNNTVARIPAVGCIAYPRCVRSSPPLYALIEEHYPRFLERLEAEGVSLPHLVNEESEAYLNYGRLEYGILRVKCDACRHEKEVARLMVPVGATLARYPPSWP